MNIRIKNVTSENLTLVYDALDLQGLDCNELRTLTGVPAQSLLLTPEQVVAVYPPAPLLVQMDERRVRIATAQLGDLPGGLEQLLQTQNARSQPKAPQKEVGAVPLWKIARACHALLPGATLLAYGFNYSVEATLREGTAVAAIAGLASVNRERVAAAFDGELLSFAATARLAFRRGQTLYDLVLMPQEEQSLRVTFNVHFEHEGIALPGEKDLEAAYRHEVQVLQALLAELFAEAI